MYTHANTYSHIGTICHLTPPPAGGISSWLLSLPGLRKNRKNTGFLFSISNCSDHITAKVTLSNEEGSLGQRDLAGFEHLLTTHKLDLGRYPKQ